MTTLGERLKEKANQYYSNKEDFDKIVEQQIKEKAKEIWEFISSIFENATSYDYDEDEGYTVDVEFFISKFYYRRSWGFHDEEIDFPFDYGTFKACVDLVKEYAMQDGITVCKSSDGFGTTWSFYYYIEE